MGEAILTGNISKNSNYCPKYVDIAAPGTAIYSTIPKDQYEYATGSSMAAAVVSGIAAEIYSLKKDISAEKVKEIILSTANVTSDLKNRVASSGFINGANAVRMTMNLE